MNQDIKFMEIAYQEALKCLEKDEVPVGAVIVKNNEVISCAHNLRETTNLATAHAEILAINEACKKLESWYLDECTLYVTLEPCVMCAGAIFWAQISRLVYGASDEKRGFTKTGTGILHPSTTIQHGILEEESMILLKTFFKNKR